MVLYKHQNRCVFNAKGTLKAVLWLLRSSGASKVNQQLWASVEYKELHVIRSASWDTGKREDLEQVPKQLLSLTGGLQEKNKLHPMLKGVVKKD